MPERFGYNNFLSPFTWKYGSREMRKIFSEINYRIIWRKIWVSLAEAQAEYGLVSEEELADLKSKMGKIDLKKAHEKEALIKHDVMAEIKTYAEQCPKGGGKIHLGATSTDIVDNADILRIREGADLILTRLINCLDSVKKHILNYKDLACMGWTHLQPAEPTTLGYRFAKYARDLLEDIYDVEILLEEKIKGKGIKGAVGTSASYERLLGNKGKPIDLERKVMEKLGLDSYFITTQTYPRKLDFSVLCTLASVAQSVYSFGNDLRHLQSPPYGEISEPIEKVQVGSTAMPFKKNPVKAERMCSLARYVSTLPKVAWDNAALSIFERTLDDSANRRIIIPEGFLAIDECLTLYDFVMGNLMVYPKMIKKNLERYGPFAATEAILMKLVEKGEDRQKMHEKLRKYSFEAWEKVMIEEENPLFQMLKKDSTIFSKISSKELEKLLDPSEHIGDAPERCETFVESFVEPVLLRYEDRIGERPKVKF